MEINAKKNLIEEMIKKARLNEEEKEMWGEYLKELNGDQLEFLYNSMRQDPKFLAKLTQDILKKMDVLQFGTDGEWDEEISKIGY